MNKTVFEIIKMDCPSEENLIRMKLDAIPSIKHLDFDIPNRQLAVFHDGQEDQIETLILELNLGGQKLKTEETDQTQFEENTNQKKLLWTVLIINFLFNKKKTNCKTCRLFSNFACGYRIWRSFKTFFRSRTTS